MSVRQVILEQINRERDRQLIKWGKQKHSHTYWNAILTEEVGEAAKEVCDYTHALSRQFIEDEVKYNKEYRAETEKRLKKELIQVAAVCVAWIESLETEHEG